MASLGSYTPVASDSVDIDEILSKDANVIAQQLHSRLQKDKPFTRIGNRLMVSVRPTRGLALFSDATSKEYAQQAKQVTKQNVQAAPHVFNVSASAYLHALRGKMDQSIVLMGESGSGKSDVYRMLVRNLCDVSKTSSKKSKIHSQVLKVDSVLTAFGNATTPLNQDASCFAQYREIQFDQKGKMVGMKLIEYLLEKSRASGPLDSGKAFHIFYYLLEGATHEERVQWHLSDPAHFSYLTGSAMAGYAQGKGTAPLDTLRSNLKSLGIGRRQQAQLWQILSAILHLGNVQFQDAVSDRETCSVRNFPQMQLVAEMLGVPVAALQMILTSKTRLIGRDNVATYLNAADAAQQRDYFARSLYQVVFGWIVEQINLKVCAADTEWSNFVSILEIPGFGGQEIPGNNFYRLMVNYANERLYSHMMHELFVTPKDAFTAQEIEFPSTYNSNKEILAVLNGPRDGILHMIDTEAVKVAPDAIAPKVYEKHLDSGVLISASSKNLSHSFGIHHYGGIVDYDTRGFAAVDADILQTDFVTLVRGNPENPGTSNAFLRSLFSDKLIATRKAGDQFTVVAANARGRTPSLRRKQAKVDDDEMLDPTATLGHLFRTQFHGLLDTLSSTQPWFIYCVKPFEGASGKVNTASIKKQVDAFDFVSMVGNPAAIYTATYPFAEFVSRYKPILSLWDRDPKTACEAMIRYKNWKPRDCIIGTTTIFLAEDQWIDLELKLKEKEDAELAKANPRNSMNSAAPSSARDEAEGFVNNAFRKYAESVDGSEISDDTASHYESEFDFGADRNTSFQLDIEMGKLPKSKLAEEIKPKSVPPPPPKVVTSLRKRWMCCTWGTTWCFFPFCLSCCGMKQKERQIAWREKFALCVIIIFMNLSVLFLIIGTGYLICPKDPRFPAQSPGEVSGRFEIDKNSAVYMYGDYYIIPDIVKSHVANYMDNLSGSPEYFRNDVLGKDVSWMFPLQNAARQLGCTMPVPAGFRLVPDQPPTTKWAQHGIGSPAALVNVMNTLKRNRGGPIVVGVDYLTEIVQKNPQTKRYILLNDVAYDLSPFYDVSLNPGQRDAWFLGGFFKNMSDFYTRGGLVGDGTVGFNSLRRQDPEQHARVKACLDLMFKVGGIDRRNDLECLIANYILLAASVVLVSVIGFKFFAALQFPGKKAPEDHDKFVICQVPCYTEGETSLHRTIDSLANLRYDDKHKLLFIICDGMIIGSGNDRPTPRIVLDILGVDPAVDPDSHAFQSLGDGNQQLNYGKVYSGLYELNGHVVPYIVVVKVGKPSERGRPGNRGKRDSQLILMRYLMRVHFNQAMSPLELEIYHHMKNIIGVDPSFYEYVLMVDADTQVQEDSLNHLVSHMTRDAKIAGTCGETSIANDRKSFTSMIQVYEYFISHHLAKAFESLFGSVTCLPGCFCMYRVRTPYKNIPVLIAPGLVADYSENTVDTLHLKNLLHLGEDRYLTTLTMKHFPNMKTTFCPDAMCQTYAPDQWSVLLSQRRRWINSTVHNLFELLRLGELCGFCCLSMRFVVFIDLLATFIQPASLVYVVYLVVMASMDNLKNVPVISLILIAAVYGFQVIIFLLKTQWQHIGWMIFYLLAIPLFGFYIPVYSFWHFDDFSWGNTRMVIETANTSAHQAEPEYFDPASVPLVKWSDYEASRKDSSSNSDTKSKMSYGTGYGYTNSVAPSNYSESVVGSSFVVGNDYVAPAGFPSDEELLQEIRHILSTTDLMKITKKSVRDQLSRLFGIDVTPRKEYIHYCIDGVLKGEL